MEFKISLGGIQEIQTNIFSLQTFTNLIFDLWNWTNNKTVWFIFTWFIWLSLIGIHTRFILKCHKLKQNSNQWIEHKILIIQLNLLKNFVVSQKNVSTLWIMANNNLTWAGYMISGHPVYLIKYWPWMNLKVQVVINLLTCHQHLLAALTHSFSHC